MAGMGEGGGRVEIQGNATSVQYHGRSSIYSTCTLCDSGNSERDIHLCLRPWMES